MTTNHVIAIDGFSSCGKSTLAKQLAQSLGFAYIDSGAMYRAMTLHFINHNVDLEDSKEIERCVPLAVIRFKNIGSDNRIFLNDEDISEEIRKMHVSEKVSKVSPISTVRRALVEQQKKLADQVNLVMDGRDIGTHVFPQAKVKLFMTADPHKRAERRHLELRQNNENVTFEEVFTNLQLRDHDDTTRQVNPLICAEDAHVIDNSELTMDQQFRAALNIIEEKLFIDNKIGFNSKSDTSI